MSTVFCSYVIMTSSNNCWKKLEITDLVDWKRRNILFLKYFCQKLFLAMLSVAIVECIMGRLCGCSRYPVWYVLVSMFMWWPSSALWEGCVAAAGTLCGMCWLACLCGKYLVINCRCFVGLRGCW